MKIANIVHEEELINHTKADFINYYNEAKSLEEIDSSLPTLYVGWSFMREVNPDNPLIQNANILKHKIVANELYWEFSFKESKASHVKGIESFVGFAPEFYFRRYSYINLDPVFFSLKDEQDLFDVLPKEIDAYYFLKEDMIYILSGKKISGLDIEMYKFFNFDIEKIVDKLTQRTKGPILHDPDGEYYEKYYKQFPNFTHLKRYLIVLLTN